MKYLKTSLALLATLAAIHTLAASGGGRSFKELDSDGDGQLSQAELSTMPTRGGRSADDRFAQLDADDDGYVSQAEMRQAREGARARRPDFSELDSDGDGQLSIAALPTASTTWMPTATGT